MENLPKTSAEHWLLPVAHTPKNAAQRCLFGRPTKHAFERRPLHFRLEQRWKRIFSVLQSLAVMITIAEL